MVYTEILQESVVCSYLNDQRNPLSNADPGGLCRTGVPAVSHYMPRRATTDRKRLATGKDFPTNDTLALLTAICKRQERSSFSRSTLSISHNKARAGWKRIGRRRGRRRGGLTVWRHAEAADVIRATAGPRILNVQITRNNTAALRPAVRGVTSS